MRPAEVLDRQASVAVRLIVVGVALAGGVVVFRILQSILLPLMFAVLVAALLVPLADRLGRHVRHGIAVAFTLTLFLGVVVGSFAYIVPSLVEQAGEAIQEVEAGLTRLPELARDLGLDEDESQEIIQTAVDRLRDNAGGIGASVSQRAIGVAATTLSVSFGAFLSLVLLTYLLVDGRGWYRGMIRLVDVDRREGFQRSTTRAWHALVVFIRSQVIVALFDAIGIAIGLILLGVPLVLPLTVLTFFLCFIPFLGAILSGLMVALVALSTQGVGAAAGMLVVAGLVQFIEGNLVYPLLVGRSLRLHPITVLLTVGTGSALLGVLGAFFATPILAAVAAGAGFLPDVQAGEDEAPALRAADAAEHGDPPPDAPAGGEPEPKPAAEAG